MAFKDTFDKLISYFDTDEVSDVEESDTEQDVQQASQPQPRITPQAQVRTEMDEPRPTRTQTRSVAAPDSQPQQRFQQSSRRQTEEPQARPVHQLNKRTVPNREQVATITLKYPRKYEDAQDIVDMLIDNECILIDFQYMLDAQARRCLDFIDGAGKVLFGTLQKVGSSMYLLAPSNVVINIEELAVPNNSQDASFDFDMKRR